MYGCCGEEELAQLMSSGQWMLVPYIPSDDDWFSAEEYPVDPYTSAEDVPSHFSTGGQDALAPPYVAGGDDGSDELSPPINLPHADSLIRL